MTDRSFFPIFLAAGVAACSGCKKPETASAPKGPPPVHAVVVEARRQPVIESLSLVGTLSADQVVEVKSETEGTVEEILFQEGQPVKKGDLLFRLDESKSAAAVAEAEANFKLSQVTYERVQQLYKDKLISQQEFDQAAAQFQANQASLELKRRQWKDTRIHASFSGITGAYNVSPGQVISKNTTLTWLVDLDLIKAEFNVPERFLSQVRVGQSIEVKVAAYPTEKFNGEVYFIGPQVDPVTRTALVKAKIPNSERKLKPGMFANLDLTLKLKDDAVVIPESAVLPSGDRTLIYIVDDADTAQIRPVKLGIRLAGQVEVLSGLQGGERVVAEGIQKVRPGGKVKGALSEADASEPTRDGRSENEKAGKRENGRTDGNGAAL
jgi:membrane fusion protein (multidrug efflux system)